jgi:hypothetical protein
MKVQFTDDQQISYNGYHVITYLSGNIYESTHIKEAQFFQSALEAGAAEEWIDKQVERVHPAKKADKKVLTPKNTK